MSSTKVRPEYTFSNGYFKVEGFRSSLSMTDKQVVDAAVSASKTMLNGAIMLEFDGSRTYDITTELIYETNPKDVSILFNGATIRFSSSVSGKYPIRIVRDVANIQTVTSVTNSVFVSHSNGTGVGGYTTTQAASFVVPDGSLVAENDVMKIISDDIVDNSNPVEGEMNGEHFTVGAVTRTLDYDGQTSNFTQYDTITGATSGATAIIHSDSDSGATGTLTLKNISGTFVDNETITGSSSGSATVNGTLSAAATVYTRQPLRYTYTTNPKVAKYAKDYKTYIGNPVVKSTVGMNRTISHVAIQIEGCINPVIDSPVIDGFHGNGTNFQGCVGGKVINPTYKNLETDTSVPYYGYGHIDGGSIGTEILFPYIENVRHGVTTNFQPQTANNDNFHDRGRSISGKVCGGFAINTRAAAFDTHPDADGWEFVNCQSFQAYVGHDGQDTNFQYRGLNGRLIGCTAFGGSGFRAVVDVDKSPTDVEFVNCRHIQPIGTTADTRYSFFGVGDSTSRAKVRFKNCASIKPDGSTSDYAMSLEYTDAVCEGFDLTAGYSGTSQSSFLLSNSTLDWSGGKIDISTSTGSGMRLFKFSDASCTLNVTGLEVRAKDVQWNSLVDFNSQAATAYFKRMVIDNMGTDTDGATGMVSGSNYFLGIESEYGLSNLTQFTENFLGFSGSTFTQSHLKTVKGTDAQIVDISLTGGKNGTAQFTSGSTSNPQDDATNFIGLFSELSYNAENGDVVCEWTIKLGSTATTLVNIGLTDQNSTPESPFELNGTTLTSNASNAIGFLFDTRATTANITLCGVKDDVDATHQTLGVTTYNPSTSVFRAYKVVGHRDGSAEFFYEGHKIGTTMTNAFNPSTPLAAIFSCRVLSTAEDTVYVDKVSIACSR